MWRREYPAWAQHRSGHRHLGLVAETRLVACDRLQPLRSSERRNARVCAAGCPAASCARIRRGRFRCTKRSGCAPVAPGHRCRHARVPKGGPAGHSPRHAALAKQAHPADSRRLALPNRSSHLHRTNGRRCSAAGCQLAVSPPCRNSNGLATVAAKPSFIGRRLDRGGQGQGVDRQHGAVDAFIEQAGLDALKADMAPQMLAQ